MNIKRKANDQSATRFKRLIPRGLADNDVLYLKATYDRNFWHMYHDAEDIPTGFITVKKLVQRIEGYADRTSIPANQYEIPLKAISTTRLFTECLAPEDRIMLTNHLKEKYGIGDNEDELWEQTHEDIEHELICTPTLMSIYLYDAM